MSELFERIVSVGLEGVEREYPNQIGHLLLSDADRATPRELHPSFYGCFDWHSAVHTHWALVRIWRLDREFSRHEEIDDLLSRHLAPEPLERAPNPAPR